MMKLSNRTILLFILLVAAALRFFNYAEVPFTHDEFSALFRTQYDSFSELIANGVKIDGHPAGIHVFLFYWTKIFGFTEWIVKLPFTVAGILSILMIYLIAKQWFNETVGLVSAAFMSSIEYTIMYSHIARPYISGLLFSLLMVYYWSKIIRTPHRQLLKNSILFALSASICTYNHHFSLLFAAIVGISGLILIQKKFLIKYLLSCTMVILLYVPHLNITLYQLNVGGVEEWLAKPSNDFIVNYVRYIFQFSMVTYLLIILLIIFGLIKIRKQIFNYKALILFTSWFLLPFIIGFFYSKFVNSVLQYSVLIFSFPFLFFILFGHIKSQKIIVNLVIVLAILIVNVYSVVNERKYYSLFYNSPYKQILLDHKAAHNTNDNVISIIDSRKNISKYYFSKLDVDSNFIWFDTFKSEKELISFLEEKNKFYTHVYFGSISSNNPLSVPIIQDYFPEIEWQNNYAGGTTYLFSKFKKQEPNLIGTLDFESKNNLGWSSIDESKLINMPTFSGKRSYLISDKTSYSPSFSISLSDFDSNENNFIDVAVKVYPLGNFDEIFLVTSLEINGKSIFWRGTSFDKFISEDKVGEWFSIYHSSILPNISQKLEEIQLDVYIWNKGNRNFLIDDFEIILRDGNPLIYGLYEKI